MIVIYLTTLDSFGNLPPPPPKKKGGGNVTEEFKFKNR